MSIVVLSELCVDDIITNEIIERLFVEVSDFFRDSKSEVVELSGLIPSMMHNDRLEIVFETLGYTIIYPEDCGNVIRIRRK